MFDMRRPDAEPELFFENGATVSHDGTVKSVVWVGDHTGVTAGEDGLIKYVGAFGDIARSTDYAHPTMSVIVGSCWLALQVVGLAYEAVDDELGVPERDHVDGALSADESPCGHVREDGVVYSSAA